MRHEIYWLHRPVEEATQLAARNAKQATRILVAVRDFGNTGRGDLKKLAGSDEWRLRAGDWRIVFIQRGEAAYITAISDRQDAYR